LCSFVFLYVNISQKSLNGTKETFQANDMTSWLPSKFIGAKFSFRSISSRAEMPSNVEIKAIVKDFEAFKNKAREISASEGNIFA